VSYFKQKQQKTMATKFSQREIASIYFMEVVPQIWSQYFLTLKGPYNFMNSPMKSKELTNLVHGFEQGSLSGIISAVKVLLNAEDQSTIEAANI
jgi:hypothetical protein